MYNHKELAFYFNGHKDESITSESILTMTVADLMMRATISGGQMIIVDDNEHMLLYMGVGLDSKELVSKTTLLGFAD